jgi:hypothetical protein
MLKGRRLRDENKSFDNFYTLKIRLATNFPFEFTPKVHVHFRLIITGEDTLNRSCSEYLVS